MLHKLARHMDAADTFEHMLTKHPDDRLVLEARGLVLQDMGDHDGAIACFTRALEVDLHSAQSAYFRGASLLQLNRPREALADFQRALDGGFRDPQAFAARAMAHSAVGDTESAIEDFCTALTMDPENIQILLNRSEAYAGVRACV
jgi:tetratricopeptide (TPR) repeat protein